MVSIDLRSKATHRGLCKIWKVTPRNRRMIFTYYLVGIIAFGMVIAGNVRAFPTVGFLVWLSSAYSQSCSSDASGQSSHQLKQLFSKHLHIHQVQFKFNEYFEINLNANMNMAELEVETMGVFTFVLIAMPFFRYTLVTGGASENRKHIVVIEMALIYDLIDSLEFIFFAKWAVLLILRIRAIFYVIAPWNQTT